jgi:hypothetical protein
MTRIRIGNIEYRETAYLNATGTYEEIVLWSPNSYYGNKEMYLKNGFTENSDGSITKGSSTIDSSCFLNPESCISICTILWNKAHDEFDVKSVGVRAFTLSQNDRKNLMRILKLIGETNND